MKKLSGKEMKAVLFNQKNEINGFYIYSNLAKGIKNKKNSNILKKIANAEKNHYKKLKKYSGKDVAPNHLMVFLYILSAKTLGLTFTLKLLENGEIKTDKDYALLKKRIPEIVSILKDEDKHEKELLDLIDEKKLNYAGSIVLGLNDALVELTGALAGYTLAIGESRLVAIIGLITGISASLSMASSEFLSKRHDGEKNDAFRSSLYTGTAYIITVLILVLPFFLTKILLFNLFISIASAVLIIFFFNFYISTAKDLSFKKRFFEMAGISISVALLSFLIGALVKKFIGVDA